MAPLRSLLLFGLAIGALSLSFILEPQVLRCFKKRVEQDDTLTGDFVASGTNERNIKVYVRGVDGDILFSGENEKEHYYSLDITKTGTYEACIQSLDSEEKVITMSFRTYHENLKYSINEESKDPLVKDMHEIFDRFITILTGVDTFQIRSSTHKNLVKQAKRRLRWSSFFKVAILIVVALAQIAIVARLFRKAKNGIDV